MTDADFFDGLAQQLSNWVSANNHSNARVVTDDMMCQFLVSLVEPLLDHLENRGVRMAHTEEMIDVS